MTVDWDFEKIEKALFYVKYFSTQFNQSKIKAILDTCKKWLLKNFYSNNVPPSSFVFSWGIISNLSKLGIDWFHLATNYTKKRRRKKPSNKTVKYGDNSYKNLKPGQRGYKS